MRPEIILIILTISAFLLLLAACGFLLWQQRAHYESLLSDARSDNKDLRDRLFLSRGLAPSGVDERQRFLQKRAESDERRRSAPPKAETIGPQQAAWAEMEEKRKRREGTSV